MIWGYPTRNKFCAVVPTALKKVRKMTLRFRAFKYRQLLLQQGKVDYVCKHPIFCPMGTLLGGFFSEKMCEQFWDDPRALEWL